MNVEFGKFMRRQKIIPLFSECIEEGTKVKR